jgi:hypothetical protein
MIEGDVHYRADWPPDVPQPKWETPLFMPRTHSRLTLRVTSVELEWLHSITDEQAVEEGCDSRDEFEDLWNSINSRRGYPWASNPIVWAIGFEVVR